MKMTITQEIDVDIDLDLLARCFAHLDDDSQAQFFVKVAEIAEKEWGAKMPQETQWWYVGRHLRTCECSTEAGRQVVRSIYEAMEYADNG